VRKDAAYNKTASRVSSTMVRVLWQKPKLETFSLVRDESNVTFVHGP
jgi:hypothetical protein